MNYFQFDSRLGIYIPHIEGDWDALPREEQEKILDHWEMIRDRIPDRVKELEKEIIRLQKQLDVEEDFATSCKLNTEISELASIINDLNLWFRTNQDLSDRKMHS